MDIQVVAIVGILAAVVDMIAEVDIQAAVVDRPPSVERSRRDVEERDALVAHDGFRS